MRIGQALPLLVVAALTLFPRSGFAQPEPESPGDKSHSAPDHVPDPAERKAARILADEGLALYQRGEYAGALGKFEQAEKLVPAITIALQLARSLDKLGRLLEARERYETIVAEELPKLSPFVAHRAQDDAGRELESLKTRIPTLELAIQGPRGEGIELFVDDKPQALASFEGVDRAIDPGPHTIDVKRKDSSISKAIKLSEGDHAKVRLLLPPIGGPRNAITVAAQREKSMREWAWVSFGIGGGFLVIGTGTGIAAVSARSDLKKLCPNRACAPAYWGKVDRYNALRATTTTAFVLTVAGAAAGTTLLVLGPKLTQRDGASISASFGLGSAEIMGEF